MRVVTFGIVALAATACTISMNVAPVPRQPVHLLYPDCPVNKTASSEIPSSVSDAPISLRGGLVQLVSTSTAMGCRHCRGHVEGIGVSGPFACAPELGICCNTIEQVFNLRVGKTIVEAPLGYSRLDCDLEGVPKLRTPVIVTGVLREDRDRSGHMVYSMKVSDVCTVAQ